MSHRVAVCTQRYKVSDRVNLVPFLNGREGHDMVDMNKPRADWAVKGLEIEAAPVTAKAVMRNAGASRRAIAFVFIGEHLNYSALPILSSKADFFRMIGDGRGAAFF